MRKINFYPKDDYDNDYDEDYDGTLDDYDPAESEMSMSAEDAMNENEDDDLEEMLDEMDGKTSAADSAFLLNETDDFSRRFRGTDTVANFTQYVADAVSGDPERKKHGCECACRDLEFFVISIMNRKFSTYIEKDPTFSEDLIQAGRQGIIASLGKYKPSISKPTTYFFQPIVHEMVAEVNLMKHDTKAYMMTAKRKIQKVRNEFAKFGRVPTIHDYAYNTKEPWRRIVNALAEMEISATKSSIDDPDSAPLIDKQANTRSPEENAMSNYNAAKIMAIAKTLEPNPIILECFREQVIDGVKTSELADKYRLPSSEISEGIKNILNLLRYNRDIRKMYPERSKVGEEELALSINELPGEESTIAFNDVMASLNLQDLASENEELDNTYPVCFG